MTLNNLPDMISLAFNPGIAMMNKQVIKSNMNSFPRRKKHDEKARFGENVENNCFSLNSFMSL